MKRKTGLLVGLLVLVLISLNACATTTVDTVVIGKSAIKTDALIPPNLAIIPPGPEISPPLAAFSGIWFGRWGGFIDHLLIIEQIRSSDEIIAVYSTGKFSHGRRDFNPRWIRTTGKMDAGGKIRFLVGEDSTAIYEMRNGELAAVFHRGGVYSEARMKRPGEGRH